MDMREMLEYDEDDSFLPVLGEKLDLNGFQKGNVLGKCSSISIKFRKRGSDLFNMRKQEELVHRMILSYYSKSIAYAPADSEELALAYSNRSLLWLRLQKYEFCSVDIERALKITKSNNLKEKLLARKEKCPDSSQSLKSKDHAVSEIPNIAPSKNIACGADCIRVVDSQEYGKHYVATRYIKVGEIISCEQTPYACVELHNFYLVCSHCLKSAWTGIPCESCVFTIYCSESCKGEAWSQYHDVMCPMLSSLMCKEISNAVRIFLIMLKILIVSIKREGLDIVISEARKIDEENEEEKLLSHSLFDCRKFGSLYKLKSKFDEEFIGKDILDEGLDRYVKVLLELLNKSPTMIIRQSKKYSREIICSSLERILKKLFGIYSLNHFKFEDVNLSYKNIIAATSISDIGDVLAPCSSLINHSCDPNVSTVFLPGVKVVMFAIRPIKKGEQIFTSYGPTANKPKEIRQVELQKTFHFWCKCKPCVEDWPDFDDSTVDPSKMQLLSKKIHEGSGKYANEISQSPDTWHCSRRLFKKALDVSNFIYQNFDEVEAFWLNESNRWYISVCFNKFYCEDLDL